MGAKGKSKGKGKGKSETRYCYDCGEKGHIGVNCPYKWANSIDEEDDQIPSWEREPDGENAEELASLETPDEEGEWCWPKKSSVTRGEGELIHDRHSTVSSKMTKTSKRPED